MSLKAAAQHIAAHGRNGDTTLVHMTHDEVRGLQELAKQHGTTLTINPQTGMPEAWSLSKLVKAAAPIAAGWALGPAGYNLMTAAQAGLAVGGGMTLLTGSLEKGIQAGLGAYGGAGLSGAAEGAGAAELGKKSVEEGVKQNLTSEALQQKVTEDMAKTSGLDKILAGASSPGTMVDAAGGAGQMTKYGLAAAAPALMEQQGGGPSVPEQQGYIRPKYYDYRTQTFYDLPAVKAKDWGARSFDEYRNSLVAKPEYASGGLTEDGMAGGGPMMGTDSAFDFQQRSEPVVRMADGGYTSYSTQQINDYINAHPGIDVAAATKEFNADPNAVTAAQNAQRTVQNVYENVLGRNADPNGLNYWANQITSGQSTPEQMYKDFLNSAQQNHELVKQGLTLEQAISPYTGYASGSESNIADEWVQNTLGRGLTEADKAQQWYKQATDRDVMNTYDVAQNIYGDFQNYAKGIGAQSVADRTALAKQIMAQKGLTDADVYAQTGKSVAQLIGAPKTDLDIFHASQLIAPITPFDFNTLKAMQKAAGVGGGYTTDTYTGQPTTTPATYRPQGASNPYGNAINPGDITINPDGSRTVTPNIPGRPYGGFTGMGQVRDAYTAGGGNLGQTLAPTRSYTNTGGSADAYKYLFGEGAWPSVTRATSPAKNTVGNTTSKYIWKDNVLVLNPDYVDPALEQAKKDAGPMGKAVLSTVDSANGGLMAAYAHGGETHLGDYSDGGRLLRGPGDGVSDSIPATIGGKQPARLADGEFVVPARIVSELGNGSTEAGARKLYAMMDRVQKARGKTVGKGKVAKNTRADKYLPG